MSTRGSMSAMTKNAVSVMLIGMLLMVGTSRAAEEPRLATFPELDLVDLNGSSVPLTKAMGRTTVINFWATWCGPCRMELPELQQLSNEFGRRGLVVLAVNVEGQPVPTSSMARYLELMKPRIDSFARSSNLSLPTYVLTDMAQGVLDEFGVPLDRIPTTFVLDAKGRIVRFYRGFSREAMRDLRQQVGAMLAEGVGKGGK
ncbi:MAG: TlpA family protein disulfide reductase [Candidatus Solibacter usitatus]|nr:TlpA family protein disulfide reductase [Candidatus Solibacter usitatus]